MKKYKITAILIVIAMLFTVFTSCKDGTDQPTTEAPSAEQTTGEQNTSVYVSIAYEEPKLTWVSVTVSDTDSDGILTINDALYCAHEQYFEEGAAGFASEETEYGLSLTKLGGIGDGAAFGYYLNNASPMSLLDEVKDGDSVYAYVYSDDVNYSDTYSYFDKNTVIAENGESCELTLSCCGFDENWVPVTSPVAGAQITVDGELTGIYTDERGVAAVTLNAGKHIISAVSDTTLLVPPICTAEVKD